MTSGCYATPTIYCEPGFSLTLCVLIIDFLLEHSKVELNNLIGQFAGS